MFTPQPIGFVSSPYKTGSEIPKGLGARHEADGALKILPDFEPGLTDIEGFSHLVVLWEFDRSQRFELLGTPPSDNRPHGVFATRSPYRPNPIGLTVVELLRRDGTDLHICWTAPRFSISNPICRTSRPKNCAVDGSPKPRRVRSKPAEPEVPIRLVIVHSVMNLEVGPQGRCSALFFFLPGAALRLSLGPIHPRRSAKHIPYR